MSVIADCVDFKKHQYVPLSTAVNVVTTDADDHYISHPNKVRFIIDCVWEMGRQSRLYLSDVNK